LAKYDLPVPGGPYNKNALQGRRLPEPTKPFHQTTENSNFKSQITASPFPQSHNQKPKSQNLTGEKLRKLHGQDNRFLKSLFGALQPRHVVPLHVGLFPNDGGVEPGPELGLFRILSVTACAVLGLGLGLGPGRDGSIPGRRWAARPIVENGPDLLGPTQVLGEFLRDCLLDLRVLLILEVRFEVLQRVHVKLERFGVITFVVFIHRLLHVLYCLFFEIAIHFLLLLLR